MPEGEQGRRARAPRQARGKERRETIIDAAAAIVIDRGIEAVTMQEVGRQSGASTGSIYHFFTDKNELLQALADRHAAALLNLFEGKGDQDPEALVALTPREVIEALFGWAIDYFQQHPDALATLPLQQLDIPNAFRDRIAAVIRIRLGDGTFAAVASALYATAVGSLLFSRDMPADQQAHVVGQLRDVMVGYLELRENEAEQ
jgi:AcrR family transcriptional regulator